MHRTIELLIGRLVTDERFRAEFLADPEALLHGLRERGLDVSPIEIAALVATDRELWTRTADALDRRLQKVNLQHEVRQS